MLSSAEHNPHYAPCGIHKEVSMAYRFRRRRGRFRARMSTGARRVYRRRARAY